MFESLNIKELKVQIKSHLADMNNKSFKEWPEVRPQAAQAAFEGRTLRVLASNTQPVN